MTRPGRIPARAGFKPRICRSRWRGAGRWAHWGERCSREGERSKTRSVININSTLPGVSGEHFQTPKPLSVWIKQKMAEFLFWSSAIKGKFILDYQNVSKQSIVSCTHLSPQSYIACVVWCGTGYEEYTACVVWCGTGDEEYTACVVWCGTEYEEYTACVVWCGTGYGVHC